MKKIEAFIRRLKLEVVVRDEDTGTGEEGEQVLQVHTEEEIGAAAGGEQ